MEAVWRAWNGLPPLARRAALLGCEFAMEQRQVKDKVSTLFLTSLSSSLTAAGASLWLYVRRMQGTNKSTSTNKLDAQFVVADPKKKRVGVNKEFVEQIRRILPTLFPSFFCREVALLGAHTVCLLARTVASIWLANMDGKIVKGLWLASFFLL